MSYFSSLVICCPLWNEGEVWGPPPTRLLDLHSKVFALSWRTFLCCKPNLRPWIHETSLTFPTTFSFIITLSPTPSHQTQNLFFLLSYVNSSLSMMALDMIDVVPRTRMEEENIAIQEAASAGLKSMEHLIRLLSPSSSLHNNVNNLNLNHLDCSEITGFTVSKFKQVINLLNRTGHARFRRSPPQAQAQAQAQTNPQPQPQIQQQGFSLDFVKPTILNSKPINKDETLTLSTTSSSFMSSVTNDASVSDGKIGPFLPPSAAKPPLSSAHRKKCRDAAAALSAKPSCHCSKKRFVFSPHTLRKKQINKQRNWC